MLTQEQIETELNLRNYWKETPAITPPAIIPPVITPPVITPPETDKGGLLERFGSLAVVGIGVLFLLAIFPGQTDETGGTV